MRPTGCGVNDVSHMQLGGKPVMAEQMLQIVGTQTHTHRQTHATQTHIHARTCTLTLSISVPTALFLAIT